MIVVYILSPILLFFLYVISLYNKFIKMNNLSEEGWAGISVQLKRRYDLIPNLIESVKGYANHEQSTFEKIIEKRNLAMNATSPEQLAEAENDLSQTLKSLFALSENYPDLKANQNFLQLQETLSQIEDDLQTARRYYNATVRNINTAVDGFPSNIIAKKYGFKKKQFFEVDEVEKQNIKVAF